MKEFKEIIDRALNYYIHITLGELEFLKNHGEDTGHLEELLNQATAARFYVKNLKSDWHKIKDYPEKTGTYIGLFSTGKPKEYDMDVIIFFDGHTYDEAHGIFPTDKDLEYGPGFYTRSVDEWNDKWVFCEYNNAFAGWMPLPEPPKEI